MDEPSEIDDNQGEYFYVERIIDVKQEGKEESSRRYRVRWAGYDPDSDTWEPSSNFHPTLLQQFEDCYEKMRKEKVASLQESGQYVTLEDIVDVNVLSKEIEKIIKKKSQCGPERSTFYEVKWKGSEVLTWEIDTDLIHAQDIVDAFLHRMRVRRLHHKTPKYNQEYSSSHQKKVKERAFYEAVEKGEDFYSRIKGRRFNNKEKSSTVKHTAVKPRKRIIQIDSSDETGDEENKDSGDKTDQVKKDCSGSSKGGFLLDLPLYNYVKSQQELERLQQQTLNLSEEEFIAAVDRDDYQTLLASLRSDYIPNLDYKLLFLKAARRGRRDIALLLATRVMNLSARDEYGNSAICMAAEQGDVCFAYHLFAMGVSRHECNGVGESLQEIASKSGYKHFIGFLQK